jgi:hypothetical protein
MLTKLIFRPQRLDCGDRIKMVIALSCFGHKTGPNQVDDGRLGLFGSTKYPKT